VWKSLVVRLLALPHWFNPVGWLAVRRFEEAGEWACDRAATREALSTEYAKLLVRLGQQPDTFGYGSAARGRTLAARIRRVLAGDPKADSTMKRTFVIAVAAVFVAASLVRVDLVAKPPAEDEESPAPPQSREQPRPASSGVVPPASKAEPEALDPAAAPRDVQQRLVEHARRAYETTLAAVAAQTTTLNAIFEWSLRWMQAAEALATNDAERLAARRDHLERMRTIQKNVQKLYDVGTKGGEEKDLAIANFYLADAERRLAEFEAAAADGEVRAQPAPGNGAARTEILDLKIKIVELRGKQQEAEAEIVAAEAALEKVDQLFKVQTNNVSRDVVERARADVAKWKSQFRTAGQQLELNQAMLKVIEAPAVANAPLDGATARSQVLDLKTRIAELRGQQQTAEAELRAAEAFMDKADMAFNSNQITRDVLERARADVQKWKSQLVTANEQLKLYEQKLTLVGSSDAPPGELRSKARAKDSGAEAPPAAKRVLLYAGRDFDTWADDLRNDLSPERRIEAINALAAFAGNGYGRPAAEAIVEAMKGYSVWSFDGTAVGRLKETALGAFRHPPGLQMPSIPKGDAQPVVLEALHSDDANQRLFAVAVLPDVVPQRPDSVPHLAAMLNDPSVAVRRHAALYLLELAPQTPGLVEIVRQGLHSPGLDDVRWALSMINHKTAAVLAPLVPDVVPLLKQKSLGIEGLMGVGGMGSGYQPPTPQAALTALGPAALPALEESLNSDDATIRQEAESLLEQIRAKADAGKAPPAARPPGGALSPK
jgi:hypothetical protein